MTLTNALGYSPTLHDVHQRSRMPNNVPGSPTTLQDAHQRSRTPTNAPGCPCRLQAAHVVSRPPTSSPGCPRHLQAAHVVSRLPTSSPGCPRRHQAAHDEVQGSGGRTLPYTGQLQSYMASDGPIWPMTAITTKLLCISNCGHHFPL